MLFFQNGNFRMNYEVHRGLVPVDTLFIHGNVASNLWWQPALEAWERRRAAAGGPDGGARRPEGSLIFAEWRGCGRSSGPSSDAELELPILAQDYIELLQSLGVTRANLVGHSTGALIALEAMKQEPALFGRSVLVDPMSARGVEVREQVRLAFIEMSRHREVLKTALSRCVHHYDYDSRYFEALVDHAFAAHPVVWAGILRVIGRVDMVEDLARIRQPTLVLHGERDAILPIEGAMEIASRLPEGRFEMLNGQGHSCQIENPERFVEIAHRFLFG